MIDIPSFRKAGTPFTLQRLFAISVFCLLSLSVVIPNSLQVLTALALVFCFVLTLPLVKWTDWFVKIVVMYFLSVLVTVFYVLVGINHGAPVESVIQTLIIYVISPVLWIFIAAALARVVSEDQLTSWFVIFGCLCVISVGLFYFLYVSFGAHAVRFFKESANVNLKEGYAGATMFVYGSLIFLTGGFFASPGTIRKAVIRYLLLGGLAISAVTSGRSALILSIPVGLVLGLILLPRVRNNAGHTGRKANKNIMLLFAGILVAGAFVYLLAYYARVNIGLVSGLAIDELFAGGGSARSEQAAALLEGVRDSNGLGVGHGVGVNYIRSYEFPWRYELVWMATLLRVGVLGAAIYLIPFAVYARKFIVLTKRRDITDFDVFMFAGFVCVFLASNTNPYIEAFSFQWMYVLPVVYLLIRSPTVR